MPLTREEVFALIDEKIFTNNSAQIQASEVNALLKTIYDNAPIPESPIKVLRAKISQSGTSAPFFHTIFENTIGTFTFTRTSPGQYRMLGNLPLNKVFVNYAITVGQFNKRVFIRPQSSGVIELYISAENPFNTYTFLDNLLQEEMLEIIVYP